MRGRPRFSADQGCRRGRADRILPAAHPPRGSRPAHESYLRPQILSQHPGKHDLHETSPLCFVIIPWFQQTARPPPSHRSGLVPFSYLFLDVLLLEQAQDHSADDATDDQGNYVEQCVINHREYEDTAVGARRAQPNTMESEPASAEPMMQLGRTRSGSAAAYGIAPSVTKQRPIT